MSALDQLEPRAVVDLYWRASLVGDNDAIRKLIGSPGDSMLWDCRPPRRDPSIPRFTLHPIPEQYRFSEEVPGYGDYPPDNTESFLLLSRAISINPEFYANRYEVAEEKTFGRESRIVFRSKEDPAPSHTYVFFLLHNGERWTLVAYWYEDQLYNVGNKRFGEQRNCPELPQEVQAGQGEKAEPSR